MSVLANILKGVQKRFSNTKRKSRFAPLSRYQKILLKHQEDVSVKKIILNSQSIFYKRPYELLHTYDELFEQEIYRFSCSQPSPVILDCGANIGLSVLYLKTILPNAIITAFEPDPDNFSLLKKNIQANQLNDVNALQAAVWKEETVLEFAGFGGQGSRINDGSFQNLEPTKVNAVRLAQIIQEQTIDFLKIDIEGAEYDVIRDCAPFLKSVNNMFLEYHGKVDETQKLAEIMDILNQNHFKTYIKLAADTIEAPFISKYSGGSFDVQLNIFCYR